MNDEPTRKPAQKAKPVQIRQNQAESEVKKQETKNQPARRSFLAKAGNQIAGFCGKMRGNERL
jgi:hypothetical protein